MMMKLIQKILLFSILITFVVSHALSQGGSNYSIFGIGDIDINPTSAYDGLAGTSIAFPLDHAMNPINPAVLSKSQKTRLLSGYRFNQNLIEDGKSNFLYQNNGKISSLSTLFVIDTANGITATFGFHPYSTVNYLIRVPIDFTFEDLDVTGRTDYQGQGGITMGYIGGSTNIIDNLSIGALAFATFGVINSTVTTSFDDVNSFVSINQVDSKFQGYGFRLGALYEPIENLYAGAYYEQHTSLEYERELTYISEVFNDSVFTNNYQLFLPSSMGFGVSYLLGKFRLGADYKLYNFKDMNFNAGPGTEYKNMNIYSIAVSRVGNPSVNAKYLDKVTYNFGLGYKELYYKVNGVDINEMYGSLGMTFPLSGSSTMIDASFTFGTRGTTSNSLVQETFGRLSIDISIGETWFKPFKREY